LALHRATGNTDFLASALKAMGYALGQQVTPDGGSSFSNDDHAVWGYWSWDPPYDYTMSGDQITHFARGIWFMLDYLADMDAKSARATIDTLIDHRQGTVQEKA